MDRPLWYDEIMRLETKHPTRDGRRWGLGCVSLAQTFADRFFRLSEYLRVLLFT